MTVKTRGMQQLAVVMTECVKCVEGCDAYKAEPFQPKDFGEFESMAKAVTMQCGEAMCQCLTERHRYWMIGLQVIWLQCRYQNAIHLCASMYITKYGASYLKKSERGPGARYPTQCYRYSADAN